MAVILKSCSIPQHLFPAKVCIFTYFYKVGNPSLTLKDFKITSNRLTCIDESRIFI